MSKISDYIKDKFSDLSPQLFNNIKQYELDVESVNEIYERVYDKISLGYENFHLSFAYISTEVMNLIVNEMNYNGWDIVIDKSRGHGIIEVDFKYNRKFKK